MGLRGPTAYYGLPMGYPEPPTGRPTAAQPPFFFPPPPPPLQVGSSFGAALCAVGGAVRALLVGAPLHFDGRRGGRVHVYLWQEVSRVT